MLARFLCKALRQPCVRRLCSFSVNSFTGRTHSCGELSVNDVGLSVILCGWVQYRRTGRFVIVRDAHGATQVLMPEGPLRAAVSTLTFESVVKVVGTVRERPPKDKNQKMETGEIEVVADNLEVLNMCKPRTPFEMRDHNAVQEERVRMEYRYLDLRRPRMQHALRFRSELVARMRHFLTNQAQFVEVDTPTLFRRTPGGAAEFLVPTRSRGEFYSLPQSPQQFKQLLMVAGLDRYFQIAKCYRDEGARTDRQPEFTQVDLELSFADSDGVIHLVEALLQHSWPKDYPPLTVPFPQMNYDKAMELYGTDKPDTRFGWTIVNVTDDFEHTDGGPFCKDFRSSDWTVQCFVVENGAQHYSNKIGVRLDELLQGMLYSQKWSAIRITDGTWKGSLSRYIHAGLQSDLYQKLNTTSGDLVMFSWGPCTKVQQTLGFLRLQLAKEFESKGVQVRDLWDFQFLWVRNFPLFLRNDETGDLESAHHPFTAPVAGHVDLLYGETPDLAVGQHYDLVLNGVELGGGSVRIHNADLQRHVLGTILREDCSTVEHLLEALSLGAPPHAGIALGLDRYVALLLGAPNIREVIAFPKTIEGRDLMSGSPAAVTEEELERFHISIRKEKL